MSDWQTSITNYVFDPVNRDAVRWIALAVLAAGPYIMSRLGTLCEWAAIKTGKVGWRATCAAGRGTVGLFRRPPAPAPLPPPPPSALCNGLLAAICGQTIWDEKILNGKDGAPDTRIGTLVCGDELEVTINLDSSTIEKVAIGAKKSDPRARLSEDDRGRVEQKIWQSVRDAQRTRAICEEREMLTLLSANRKDDYELVIDDGEMIPPVSLDMKKLSTKKTEVYPNCLGSKATPAKWAPN